jgi:CheY-like chemotaxis protein
LTLIKKLFLNSSFYIIVVDDDEEDRYLLKQVLEENSFPFSSLYLGDGTELIDFLESTEVLPLLIVLDINMPVMNGFDALMTLKNEPEWKNIPVIIHSTSDYYSDIIKAEELGAFRYFPKAASYRELAEFAGKLSSYGHSLSLLQHAGAKR